METSVKKTISHGKNCQSLFFMVSLKYIWWWKILNALFRTCYNTKVLPSGPHKEFAHDKKYIKVASSYICIYFYMLWLTPKNSAICLDNYVLFKCSAFKKAKMLFAFKNICSRIQEQWWNCNMILRLSVGGPLFPLSRQWSILPLHLASLILLFAHNGASHIYSWH